jgi:hypothetical protein
MTDEFLTDIEKAKLEQFAADEEMFDAVKKVALAWIYEQGTIKKGKKKYDGLQNFLVVHASRNPSATDEQLGQHLRAVYQGLNALENAFQALAQFKQTPPPPPKGQNKAR